MTVMPIITGTMASALSPNSKGIQPHSNMRLYQKRAGVALDKKREMC